MATGQGVGARLIRKEDDRLMRGRGQFVADLRFAGMQDVAFVRSPLAHARIRGIVIPPALKDAVFVASDLVGVKPIRAVSGLRGFKVSAAARPTSSVPAKANAALTKTLQRPLKPL